MKDLSFPGDGGVHQERKKQNEMKNEVTKQQRLKSLKREVMLGYGEREQRACRSKCPLNGLQGKFLIIPTANQEMPTIA